MKLTNEQITAAIENVISDTAGEIETTDFNNSEFIDCLIESLKYTQYLMVYLRASAAGMKPAEYFSETSDYSISESDDYLKKLLEGSEQAFERFKQSLNKQ